jgi:hypothetical protein
MHMHMHMLESASTQRAFPFRRRLRSLRPALRAAIPYFVTVLRSLPTERFARSFVAFLPVNSSAPSSLMFSLPARWPTGPLQGDEPAQLSELEVLERQHQERQHQVDKIRAELARIL